MDYQNQKSRKINPRENSSIFSIVFYRYVFETLRTGARRTLTDNDIYRVLKKYESERLCSHLEREWKKELKKSNPSILNAFFRMFGVEYVLWGLGMFFLSLLSHHILLPIMSGKLMTYFEPGQNVTKSEAISYVVSITLPSVIVIIYDNTYLFSILAIGLKLRMACSSLIYKKCLKLNLNANPEYDSGRVITLITKDVSQFADAADFGHILCMSPPRALIVTGVMYKAIGPSSLVGVVFLIGLMPIFVFCGKLTIYYRLITARKTDQRVKLSQEIFTAMRIIKMHTWEQFYSKCVNALRLKEVKNLRILLYVKAIAYSVGEAGFRFAFYACVIIYIALGNHITPENAVIFVASFDTLDIIFRNEIPLGIAQMAELKASLNRITSFLMLEEVSGNHCEKGNPGTISINDVTVATAEGLEILQKVNLDINKGLTIINGPTGAGKSTFLKLLLGDVTNSNGKIEVHGHISYSSQEPWLFPATVRQNILFGEEFDPKRYREVLRVCALEKDLLCFPHGDGTLLTDKGLNLSKGQKSRINLARAVYRRADIYLFDDCFSSVDTGVCHHIFNECMKTYLRNFSCILVTNNINLFKYADHVLTVDNGNVQCNEKVKCYTDAKILQTVDESTSPYSISTKNLESGDENELSSLLPNNEIYRETSKVGVVDKKIYFKYMMSGGGYKMVLLVILCAVAAQATSSWTDYFVSFWVDIEQELSQFKINGTDNSTEYQKLEDKHDYIIKLYSAVILLTAFCIFLRSFVFFLFSSKASTNIHDRMLEKLLKTSIVFFDTHLSGNIVNRFSRDLGILDEQLPLTAFQFLKMFLSVIAVFIVVSSVNLYFIIPSVIVMVLLYYGRRYYIPSGRNLRRLEGAARSPLIGYLCTTMDGLTTVRAHGVQEILITEFNKHQDHYTSAAYMNLSTAFGFALYIDLICACYVTIITSAFLFLKTDVQAGKIGLALTQSRSVTGLLQWGVRVWSEVENLMTSAERILEYDDVKPESNGSHVIENWPNKGSISYKNVNLIYSPHTEKILKNVNFNVKSKEKIGIVGRTGAGKTSIISTLFRMYNFDGVITIDDVDITMPSVNLLRSKISVIPQDPVLFSGTIRTNLDPYLEYTDDALWNALDEVKMKNHVSGLDDAVYESGMDFSAGQKQLLCLARAIIRNNAILILDEATANIDVQTDSIIQDVIKTKFVDCTVITIAHKLSTVLHSDKVLVMDLGEVVQFGPPDELIKHENKPFYVMLKASGLI